MSRVSEPLRFKASGADEVRRRGRQAVFVHRRRWPSPTTVPVWRLFVYRVFVILLSCATLSVFAGLLGDGPHR